MKLVIEIPEGLKKDFELEQWTALSCMEMKDALMNGTPLESYLPNERCDTCKYVDCSIDNEPCIDCKVPHKSFYEPRQGLEGDSDDERRN